MTKRCGEAREGETSAGSSREIDSIRMMLKDAQAYNET